MASYHQELSPDAKAASKSAEPFEELRSLLREGRLPIRRESEETPSKGGSEDEDDLEDGREKSASRYIGDVLDSLHGAGHLSDEDIDSAAACIANNADEGHEAVMSELIRKGLIPGKSLMQGGQRRLKERVKRAMRESIRFSVAENLVEGIAARRRMTERERGLAERLDEEVREAIHSVLVREGYNPLDADHLMDSIRQRVRRITNGVAMESSKRSIRPMGS